MKIAPSFYTSNFYLAAFMLASGFTLQGYERSDDGKVTFVIEDGENREEAVDSFHCGNPQVDARRFIAAIRQLKSGIYDGAAT